MLSFGFGLGVVRRRWKKKKTRFTVRKIEFSFSSIEADKNQLTPFVPRPVWYPSVRRDDLKKNLLWSCFILFWHAVFKWLEGRGGGKSNFPANRRSGVFGCGYFMVQKERRLTSSARIIRDWLIAWFLSRHDLTGCWLGEFLCDRDDVCCLDWEVTGESYRDGTS